MVTKSNPIKILVVDDETDIREGCVRVLRRLDCEVSTASDGKEGLARMENEEFSIILLDLKMPGMDGMDVLAEIRQRGWIPLVIVITGFATVETAIEAMKRGAYDFIPKPFDPAQLRIVVERAMENVRLRQEAERLAAERKRTLADLGTEKSRASAIVESLPIGVAVTDNTGKVVMVNPAFKTLVGIDRAAAPGEDISAYIEDEDLCRAVKMLSEGCRVDGDDTFTRELKIGDDRYLLARGRPVMGEEGDCLGTVLTLGDITSLKILDQMKSDFVAKVSHELRSPLSTIHEQLGAVLQDMAEEGGRDPEDQYILSRAKEKTRGLIALIGDLLDLSRIEAGAVAHNVRPVRLDELLASIVDFLRPRAKAKSQTLELELEGESFPEIEADPMALESIFGNLVTNAINYTGEGGKIEVVARVENGCWKVAVKDNGFGIDPRHHDKIFEKFYRVKDENTRLVTGTGLGLPIVKGLVDRMGGRIELESEPGKGSTFTVTLPLAQSG